MPCFVSFTLQGLRDFIFDNTHKIDPEAEEKEARAKYPYLLHQNEKVEMAFRDRGGAGRDKEYFTSHRILIKDGKGVGNKRKNYTSIPYDAIVAFSIQSQGAAFDSDCEFIIYSTGLPKVQIDFAAKSVNIFEIYQYMNSKISWSKDRGTADEVDLKPPEMRQTRIGNAIDWLGDNARQVDAATVEEAFKTQAPVLLADERVELAFKSGRDHKVFTNRRILMVDVKGVGKRVEYLTIPYGSIHAFYVQTAGHLDRDTELRIYTNMVGELYQLDQDFRNGRSNLWAIQKVLANHILGEDEAPLPDVDNYEGHQDSKAGLFGLITGLRFNERPIDAVALDKALHHDPPILQGSEKVEMAFQGFRDITVFTTKRVSEALQ